jgi:hypothetical protein
VVEYVKDIIQVSMLRDLETMLRLTILWREKESDIDNREAVGKHSRWRAVLVGS